MRFNTLNKLTMPAAEDCLPGRTETMPVPPKHAVLGTPLEVVETKYEKIYLAMGCFWGAERLFWQLDGVYSTSVGYAGGVTPNPTYEEVCSGLTGHTEIVQVVFNPQQLDLPTLLVKFWEEHDPTQGYRQGNDRGTQYRSAIYFVNEEQGEICMTSRDTFQTQLQRSGKGEITTEIKPLETFYFAESYHQQYLFKNPNGYCGLAGTGVKYCN